GCTTDATARIAGAAGLLYAMARSQTPPLDLSAEEAMQLLKMTADDVDVAESRSPDRSISARFASSKAGWDQRFGYGRANVAHAIDAVGSRLIPPEVDVTAPEAFAPIYADRTQGQVAIEGRIAATRAVTYDYAIAWAPGIEPDDGDFKPLMAPVTNVPS